MFTTRSEPIAVTDAVDLDKYMESVGDRHKCRPRGRAGFKDTATLLTDGMEAKKSHEFLLPRN